MSNDSKSKFITAIRRVEAGQRPNLRGWKKCRSCGQLSGIRSILCPNVDCELRKKVLASRRPFDPVQLIDYSGSLLFSLRTKEKEAQPRNFVHISEVQLSFGAANGAIISKNSICYHDSCKTNGIESTAVLCKHIKACKSEPGKNDFRKAEVYTIDREILYNMNISLEQKNEIWNIYKADESLIPAVQRLNTSTFVVRCKDLQISPSGRLHVNAFNGSAAVKRCNYSCCCKKLISNLDLDNSVLMPDEVCEHILMLLAAILSHANLKISYCNFIKSLKSYWMTNVASAPMIDITHIEILPNSIPQNSISLNGILQNEISLNEISLSDISENDIAQNRIPQNDITLNDISENDIQQNHITQNDISLNDISLNDISEKDISQNIIPQNTIPQNTISVQSNIPQNEVSQKSISPSDISETDTFLTNSLDLNEHADQTNSDDGIFLFNDSFMANEILPDLGDVIMELTKPTKKKPTSPGSLSPLVTCFSNGNSSTTLDVMHLADPNLSTLNEDSGMDLQTITTLIESIERSSPDEPALELTDSNIELINQFQLTDSLDICTEALTLPTDASITTDATINIFSPQIETTNIAACAVNNSLKSNNIIPNLPNVTVLEAPIIELPTIEVVRKNPSKTPDVINQSSTKKITPLPAKRSLIVNGNSVDKKRIDVVNPPEEPSLSYSAWLEYVIECINESVSINEQNNVSLNFYVHEEIFTHFNKTFSMGNKLRVPNSTTIVKQGARKGLTKYIWYFQTTATVRRIFQTKNIAISLERNYELGKDGVFIPYVPNPIEIAPKGRRIYPKLMLYTAYINFAAADANHKTGIKLEWIPKVYPKSKFGSLTIGFSLNVRDPQPIPSNKTA